MIGSSIAMVAIGPMPGSTPISVPTMAPMKAKPRLAGVSATPKPIARLSKNSIAYHSGQTGMVRPSPKMKIAHDSSDQHERRDRGFQRPQRARRQRADAGEQQDGDNEAEPLDAQAERDEARASRTNTRAPRLRRGAQRRGRLPQALAPEPPRRGPSSTQHNSRGI